MMSRAELEGALADAEHHRDAAQAEVDRLLRHLGAEIGVTSERKLRAIWEETKATKAGKTEPDPVAVATCCAGLVTLGNPKAPEADNADAIAAYVDGYAPAVRECAEVREAVAARLAVLALVKV